MAKAANKADKKKRAKFDTQHPEGRKAFAATKRLEQAKKRRSGHVARGKNGHLAKPRKVLSNEQTKAKK